MNYRHRFNSLDKQTPEVVEEITLRPRSHPWWLVGMGM